MCVVDVRVRLRSSVGILDEALDLTADLCTALFLHFLGPAGRLASVQELPPPCFHTGCVPIPPGLFAPGCQFVVGHFELPVSPMHG